MNSIKLACIIFFAVILSLTVNAQHISLGPSVGAGISTVSNDAEGVDVNPQFLWNAGITFIYSTKTHFGFGADLKYSAEGYKISFLGLADSFDSHIHLNYARLPVRIIYFFGEYGDHVRPKIFLGLTPGLLLSAKGKSDGFGTTDFKEQVNSFDLGVQGGVGLNVRLASAIWLNADLSIYQGFLNIVNEADDTALNRNLAVNVGVAFGIGGE